MPERSPVHVASEPQLLGSPRRQATSHLLIHALYSNIEMDDPRVGRRYANTAQHPSLSRVRPRIGGEIGTKTVAQVCKASGLLNVGTILEIRERERDIKFSETWVEEIW